MTNEKMIREMSDTSFTIKDLEDFHWAMSRRLKFMTYSLSQRLYLQNVLNNVRKSIKNKRK